MLFGNITKYFLAFYPPFNVNSANQHKTSSFENRKVTENDVSIRKTE